MIRVILGTLLTVTFPVCAQSQISAIWANNGEDKVAREELRASSGGSVQSSVWDGATIRLFGARNEVVSFNLVLEARSGAARQVSVGFDRLTGPGGATITSASALDDGVFDWTDRAIELFFVRYLQIRGLSADLHYDDYDERHIPERFRRPWRGDGEPLAGTGWRDRPDHDRSYPDIAVPLELVGDFEIAAGSSQSIWADIYIPKSAAAGTYRGTISVRQPGGNQSVAVELRVFDHTLPDDPTAKTMLYIGHEDIANRYTGNAFPPCGSSQDELNSRVRDRHFQVAHRHRVSLIDSNAGECDAPSDRPRAEWIARLDGSLFTAARGYAGPGVGVGNGVFSIGTYGSWDWQGEGQQSMWRRTDAWESWFRANSPATERFLYLTDEPDTSNAAEMAEVQQWASWMDSNPGPGGSLRSLVTMSAPDALTRAPSLDIAASWFNVGPQSSWQAAVDSFERDPDKRVYFYNGHRPAGGTFAIEDDGVALRVLAWVQHKMGVDRWFFWEGTYYNNFQGSTGETNVFRQAMTFGDNDGFDNERGESGWNYGNGDGVLFYPGTDVLFPADSYGVSGPFASLRLKHWRRGIQDVEYLVAAARRNPSRVTQIVEQLVPRVMWENGVSDPQDPTWVLSDISWSTDPDVWEAARCELAGILDPALGPNCLGNPVGSPPPTCGTDDLCLTGNRFAVSARWRTASDAGTARPVPLTDDSGAFWFFGQNNLELMVKVLDGCAVSGSYWVFGGGLTDVEVELLVVDTRSGASRIYRNALGTAFQPIRDTAAFAACTP